MIYYSTIQGKIGKIVDPFYEPPKSYSSLTTYFGSQINDHICTNKGKEPCPQCIKEYGAVDLYNWLPAKNKNKDHFYSDRNTLCYCGNQVYSGMRCYKCCFKDKKQCAGCFGMSFEHYINEKGYCTNCSHTFDIVKSDAGEFVSARKYGIELELCGPQQSIKGWLMKYDGSVNQGHEYVSPIMCGYDKPMDSLYKFCEEIEGTSVDSSCGFHLHIDVSDFTPAQLQTALLNAKDVEDQIFMIVNKSRQKSTYCKHINYTVPTDTMSSDGWMKLIAGHDRYYWFNTNSFSRFKTIEIRIHQGSQDAETIEKWVDLWLGFFEYSKAARNNSIFDIMRQIGVRKSTREYYEKIYSNNFLRRKIN